MTPSCCRRLLAKKVHWTFFKPLATHIRGWHVTYIKPGVFYVVVGLLFRFTQSKQRIEKIQCDVGCEGQEDDV